MILALNSQLSLKATIILLTLSITVQASHFRGAAIQWRPTNSSGSSFNGEIEITHRISWIRSSFEGGNCDANTITERILLGFGSVDTLECSVGCVGMIGNMDYYCTDFSVEEEWSAGQRSYLYNNLTGVDYFEASFTGGDWTTLVLGGALWEIRVKGNLSVRTDIGRVNSSPTTVTFPDTDLLNGCNHTVVIPVNDVDRDVVRCRWAVGNECADVCNGLPAVLLEDQCTLHVDALNISEGFYAVALQVEDFATVNDTEPLSSVPIQFLIHVVSNPGISCDTRPVLVGETPNDRSCIGVQLTEAYTGRIVARAIPGSSISEIVTVSPPGLQKSELSAASSPGEWFVDLTWTPESSMMGPNILCFTAQDILGVFSLQSCITLFAGGERPTLVPYSVSPKGLVTSDNTSKWMAEFSISFVRPSESAYIRIFKESGIEVVSIDASSSDDVIYPESDDNQTLTFLTNSTFMEGVTYYVTLDSGVVTSRNVLCNVASSALLDSTVWNITIMLVPDPCLSDPCDVNADCQSEGLQFNCTCRPPTRGNGTICLYDHPVSMLFPFGTEEGDLMLSGNDDLSSEAIILQSGSLPLFGIEYNTLYVNNDGDISFNSPFDEYDPRAFPFSHGSPIIAPFWADIDTSGADSGSVFYRETQDAVILQRIRGDIQASFTSLNLTTFNPSFLFITTWYRVGYYPMRTNLRNTFQCVLVTDNQTSFVIFLYRDIEWISAESQGGVNGSGGNPALAGINAGDGEISITIPGSLTNNILDIVTSSNVNISRPGLWMFQVDGFDINIPVPDPCLSDPCDMNAHCQQGQLSDFNCTCTPPFEGTGINCSLPDPCLSDPCDVNAVCVRDELLNSNFTCTCTPEYTGNGFNCTVPDPCLSGPCDVNADCVREGLLNSNFTCTCTPEFTGNGFNCTVPDPCLSDPCDVNADCVRDGLLNSNFTCTCAPEYTGDGFNCTVPDPCLSGPCDVNAVCVRDGLLNSNFTCTCAPEFTGDGFNCTVPDSCLSDPCDVNADCVRDGLLNSNFTCTCTPEYTGDGFNCTVPDPCLSDPCDVNADCVRDELLNSNFTCTCTPEFTGDGFNCTVPDPCLSDPCDINANCQREGLLSDLFNCTCTPPFEGTGFNCLVPDPCLSGPCDVNADCVRDGLLNSNFTCTCTPEYTGDGFNCTVPDPCLSEPCNQNATCTRESVLNDIFSCVCLPTFVGDGFNCTSSSGNTGLTQLERNIVVAIPSVALILIVFVATGVIYGVVRVAMVISKSATDPTKLTLL